MIFKKKKKNILASANKTKEPLGPQSWTWVESLLWFVMDNLSGESGYLFLSAQQTFMQQYTRSSGNDSLSEEVIGGWQRAESPVIDMGS